MRIGTDHDEVLMPLLPHYIKYHNELYKTKFKLSDFKSYYWWETLGCTRDVAVELFYGFVISDDFLKIKPIPGAVESIRRLSKEHELYDVTSRQNFLQERTIQAVERHFGNSFKGFLFGNNYSYDGEQVSKVELVKKEKLDVLLDDDLKHLKPCAETGIHTVVFDLNETYKWNQNSDSSQFDRVTSWKEFEEYVEKILVRYKNLR